MRSFTRWVYRVIIISVVGVTSTYTAGFDTYFNELRHFQLISQNIHNQKNISDSLKDEHNQLAIAVNECIDYLLWTLDHPTEYQDHIAGIVMSINDKAKELQEQYQQERDKSLKTQASGAPQTLVVISLSTQAIQAAYKFLKELKDDSQKDKIKQDLIACKWRAL
jgi:hypothetical protein